MKNELRSNQMPEPAQSGRLERLGCRLKGREKNMKRLPQQVEGGFIDVGQRLETKSSRGAAIGDQKQLLGEASGRTKKS